MKEPNYSKFRALISSKTGSPILPVIRENAEELGLDPDVFDLVYEGFWDLYTFKPKIEDISAKKLLTWIQKLELRVPENSEQPAKPTEGEEGQEEAKEAEEGLDKKEESQEKPSAIIHVKIPKQKPEPQLDEEGNVIEESYNESDLEEIPFDDKCLSIATNVND